MLYYYYHHRNTINRERRIQDKINPLEKFNDVEVKSLLRFEKHNVLRLCKELNEALSNETKKGAALPTVFQVCLALNYFATGTYQNQVAKFIGVNQSTASRTIWRFIQAINNRF